ncbi:uncharacterized protein LOC125943688 [Dermacentor silvarum]|uniref:uncharacterized protein LOC125943688 n=1 Tax=Dermacentor silvarum TaxID=543639 RepID=UPI002101611D|nr:uncharacterized protein LOC125943688 [Dermacentor silvarum]
MVAGVPSAGGKAPAVNVAPAAAPVRVTPAVIPAVTKAPVYADPRSAEPSKMYSDVQVLMMEQTGDMAELGSYSFFNICCNLFMGACIGATTVLLVMFFFTDCRFVMKKHVEKNKSRAGIEELDRATHLDLAATTLTVLALEDTSELTSSGVESSSPEEASSSITSEDAVTNGIRKRPTTKHVAKPGPATSPDR